MTYNQYLNKVVDELFEVASTKWTWGEWAEHAGLSPSTVYNLGNRVTKRPQLRTVFLLAKSLNMNLPAIINKPRLRKVA